MSSKIWLEFLGLAAIGLFTITCMLVFTVAIQKLMPKYHRADNTLTETDNLLLAVCSPFHELSCDETEDGLWLLLETIIYAPLMFVLLVPSCVVTAVLLIFYWLIEGLKSLFGAAKTVYQQFLQYRGDH